jgi:hypothetical protein
MVGTKVKEHEIIDIISKFSEFKNFYDDEWEPRKKHGASIDWYINPTCGEFAAQGFYLGKPWIQLHRLPENVYDAFLTAHEIGHVIRYFDKQYVEFKKARTPIAGTYKEEEIIDMGSRLGSMLDDPLIDSHLQDKYNFDAPHFYKSVLIPDTNKSLDSYGDPPHEWHILKKALYYSQLLLQCDSIKDSEVLRERDKLKERYKVIRPRVTKIGEELYQLSNGTGYDTIDKQKRLFGEILDKYRINSIKLGDILRIK